MAHITACVSHGASPSGDWGEPWDVHQTPRANNWLLPTIKVNQNVFHKTGAPEWDKWHQLILKSTRPKSCLRVEASDGRAALKALSMIVNGFIRSVRRARTRASGKPEGPGQAVNSLWPPSTVNLPDNNICWTKRHSKRALLAAMIQENDWTNNSKDQSHPSCPILSTQGEPIKSPTSVLKSCPAIGGRQW